MSGDYVHFQQLYTRKIASVVLAATDAGKNGLITVRSPDHQIYIQKISYNPIIAFAQPVIFQDSNGAPLILGTVPASQSTPFVFDYGPTGIALTIGANLDCTNVAGPSGLIHIEGYERLRTDKAVAVGSNN